MSLRRLGRNIIILIAVVVGVYGATIWYAVDTTRLRGDIERQEENLAKERRALRTLQGTGDLAAVQKELAALQEQAPASIKQPLPTNVDMLKTVADLLSRQPTPGKIINVKAKETKPEKVDGYSVQNWGYDIGLQGSAVEVLTALRRVDEASLVSEKIPSFSMDRLQDDNWSIKLDLSVYAVVPNLANGAPAAGNGKR